MLNVLVRDLFVAKGTVSGVLVNNTGQELQRVDLLIRHNWNNELSPKRDNSLSKEDLYTVQEQIPAGEKVPFTYYPESPPYGVTSVIVISYTL